MPRYEEKKELRIGLIGFGSMGKTHAYCIENLKFFYPDLPFCARVAGVCTRSLEKSRAVAKDFGFDVATDNENDLIYSDEIDVIDVCTPNVLHYETVKKAILAGKHVLCEKPLGISVDEARELTELARASSLVCGMVFNNRFLSPILRAKQLIDEGRIGRVLSFSAEYLHNSCTDIDRIASWKQDESVCGGGVLFDLGSHIIDLIRYLCGDFESITGRSQIAFPERRGSDGLKWQTNADEAFYMLAALKSGAVGTLTASKLINGANDDLSISVYGERGSLKFSLMQPNFLYFYDVSQGSANLGGLGGYTAIECVGRYTEPTSPFPSVKAPQGWLRGHVGSMYSYLNAVFGGSSHHPDFYDGLCVQKIMDAAYRSAKEGKEIIIE